MRQILCAAALATAVLVTTLEPASAHTGIGAAAGPWAGFGHPLSGLDHVLAMLAVGLWAVQLGGRAFWLLPATFLSVMALAGIAGAAGPGGGVVELGIAGSVLILGALVAFGRALPLTVSIALVGLFAVFHGHGHGAEMAEGASGLAYGLGFLLATALLHGTGMMFGLAGAGLRRWLPVRLGGGAIAAAGLVLLIG